MPAKVAAVIVAAGRGYRAGGDLPKQYRALAGEPVIRPTLAAFLGHPQIVAVQAVIHPDDAAIFRVATAGLGRLLPPVPGGATRQASVRAGLEALRTAAPDLVLIHDAARPFLSSDLISRAIAAATAHGAAVPAVAVTETVKVVDERDMVSETLDRSRLRTV
jgi:2-C-methyl-D-erythritol 4-phosphate cytidylyltransferase / 2-C-methyl-D-erythritol 2,4-cyclodiphosphate synthase